MKENSVWCQIDQKCVITIQIWFDSTRFRIVLSVYGQANSASKSTRFYVSLQILEHGHNSAEILIKITPCPCQSACGNTSIYEDLNASPEHVVLLGEFVALVQL